MEKEILPYLGREVWIKKEVVDKYLYLRTLGLQRTVYEVHSWAEDSSVETCDSADVLRLNSSDPLLSVFFIPGHSFFKATKVVLTSTGTPPDPLVSGNAYWVIVIDDSMVRLATTELNARGGNFIGLNSQGTGTHTLTPDLSAGPWYEFRWVPFGMKNY